MTYGEIGIDPRAAPLGRPAQDWPARYAAYVQRRLTAAAATVAEQAAPPAQVGPSLPPARYPGTYADPWYGKVVVGSDKD